MKKLFASVALVVATAVVSVAHAQCDRNTSAACMRSALESADRQLNAVFKSLLVSATPEKEAQLRAAQKAWLRVRNDTCALPPGSTSSADWLTKLSDNLASAGCVYDTTIARVRYLQDIPTINHVDELIATEDYTFPASRASGKLYAEVAMQVGSAGDGKTLTGLAQMGVTDTRTMVGTQIDFSQALQKATPAGLYVVGMAIDLDNGKFYFTENGKWRAEPGSGDGIELRRGQAYALRVSTPGRTLSRLMSLGSVRINTGSEPFHYATPPGYEAYYKPPVGVAGGSRLDWIVPTYQKVGNRSLSEWADRYWAWLLVKTPQRNPVTDTTGEFCGEGQAGTVWFLASGDAKSHILRRCTVPRGKFLMLPAIAMLLRSEAGSQPCAKLESDRTPAIAAANIDAVYVSIDGQRFDSFYGHRVYTERCQTVRGEAGETVVADSVYFGAWVLLQPLPPGEHVIRFGGKLEDFQQNRDVTYKILVE